MTGFDFENFDEKEKQIANIILQGIKDDLEGGLTSRNIKSFRNTYVINAQDSLDADFPMYVHFNILSEMIKIVSVKVSFWILNYRAYSKAGVAAGTPSGGGSTSGAGGGQTSGAGGDETTGESSSGLYTAPYIINTYAAVTNVGDEQESGALTKTVDTNINLSLFDHAHSQPHHHHSVEDHQHTTPPHTHPEHTHDAVYGIFEEINSPVIKFYVSENAGISYNDTFFGGYTTKKSDLEITSLLTGAGSKLIKFESDLRARLSVQIEIKLDIKAR